MNLLSIVTIMADNKRFYRSHNKCIAGVCGGVADYFGWDPTVVRLVYLVATFSSAFSGFLLYIVLWIFVPQERYGYR